MAHKDLIKTLRTLDELDLPLIDVIDDPQLVADFKTLISESDYTWSFTLPHSGLKFSFKPLQEWEEREIAKKLSNYDNQTKLVLRRLECLVYSIDSITGPSGKIYQFEIPEDRIDLRVLLLSLNPEVLDYLYSAYEEGSRHFKEYIRKKYGNISELLASDFFELPG